MGHQGNSLDHHQCSDKSQISGFLKKMIDFSINFEGQNKFVVKKPEICDLSEHWWWSRQLPWWPGQCRTPWYISFYIGLVLAHCGKEGVFTKVEEDESPLFFLMGLYFLNFVKILLLAEICVVVLYSSWCLYLYLKLVQHQHQPASPACDCVISLFYYFANTNSTSLHNI